MSPFDSHDGNPKPSIFRGTCYVALLKIQLLLGVDQQHMYSIWFNINMPWCIIYIYIYNFTRPIHQSTKTTNCGDPHWVPSIWVRTLLQRISLPSKAVFCQKNMYSFYPQTDPLNLPILWDPLTTVVRLEAGSKFCRCSSAQTSGSNDSRGFQGVWWVYPTTLGFSYWKWKMIILGCFGGSAV